MTRTDTAPLSFDDRFRLAVDQVAATFEARNGFLSDDDLLDAADAFTTDTMDDDGFYFGGDYARLRDRLFDYLG